MIGGMDSIDLDSTSTIRPRGIGITHTVIHSGIHLDIHTMATHTTMATRPDTTTVMATPIFVPSIHITTIQATLRLFTEAPGKQGMQAIADLDMTDLVDCPDPRGLPSALRLEFPQRAVAPECREVVVRGL
jgi:hypothetical protein